MSCETVVTRSAAIPENSTAASNAMAKVQAALSYRGRGLSAGNPQPAFIASARSAVTAPFCH